MDLRLYLFSLIAERDIPFKYGYDLPFLRLTVRDLVIFLIGRRGRRRRTMFRNYMEND